MKKYNKRLKHWAWLKEHNLNNPLPPYPPHIQELKNKADNSTPGNKIVARHEFKKQFHIWLNETVK